MVSSLERRKEMELGGEVGMTHERLDMAETSESEIRRCQFEDKGRGDDELGLD